MNNENDRRQWDQEPHEEKTTVPTPTARERLLTMNPTLHTVAWWVGNMNGMDGIMAYHVRTSRNALQGWVLCPFFRSYAEAVSTAMFIKELLPIDVVRTIRVRKVDLDAMKQGELGHVGRSTWEMSDEEKTNGVWSVSIPVCCFDFQYSVINGMSRWSEVSLKPAFVKAPH